MEEAAAGAFTPGKQHAVAGLARLSILRGRWERALRERRLCVDQFTDVNDSIGQMVTTELARRGAVAQTAVDVASTLTGRSSHAGKLSRRYAADTLSSVAHVKVPTRMGWVRRESLPV